MLDYFRPDEFSCKCGCGLSHIDPRLVSTLNLIRHHAGPPPGMPLVVNSGCRCTAHNTASGGAPDSSHTVQDDGYCHAVDIRALSSATRFKIVVSALLHGITRIGVSFKGGFVHLDNDKTKPQGVFWGYD